MADKIKLVFNDFQKATSELQKIKVSLDGYKAELLKKYSAFRVGWKGTAGEVFEKSYEKIIKDFEINIKNLEKLCTDIEQTGKTMEEADKQFSQQISLT